MTSDTTMLSPMPRKAFDLLPSVCSSGSPWPAHEDMLLAERPFWYDADDVTCDLHEALRYKNDSPLLPGWSPAFVCESFSTASTSAGPSPDRDLDRSSSRSGLGSPPVEASALCESPEQMQSSSSRRGSRDKSARSQVRKVFVGGIPQSIGQNDLFKMFSTVAKVKKAWLQYDSHATNHRGFGFVVLSEENAVDQLLGEDFSRFICFGDGLRFEVKRAVGEAARVPAQSQEEEYSAKRTQRSGKSSAQAVLGSKATPVQTSPADACANVRRVSYVSSWGAVDRVGPRLLNGSMTAPAPQDLAQQRVQYSMLPPLCDALLDGLVGRRPCNEHELEWMLLQAMPDHYDD